TDHAEEVEELIRAERVGFDRTAPVRVDGAAAFRTDPVAPVVFVGEASARIADIGNLESLQRVDHVRAYPANVGDVGIGPYPDAAIDAGAEVLGELAEDVPADPGAGLFGFDGDRDVLRKRRSDRARQQRAGSDFDGKPHYFLSPPRRA